MTLIQPLDLVLFKSNDPISGAVRVLERSRLQNGDFSHVGLIVTHDILPIAQLNPGKLYIWESTFGGTLGRGIKNIQGKSFFGTQVRDFNQVLTEYKKDGEVHIAHLRDPPTNVNLRPLYIQYNNRPYEFSAIKLLASLFPFFRPLRNLIPNNKWMFCSELCFTIYQKLGLYDSKFNPEDVVPVDFLGHDEDGIPNIFTVPVQM
jgi:hypothetical protein